MADKYHFKLYNETPTDAKTWEPVLWSKNNNNAKITFEADPTWTAVDFKAFRIEPKDDKNLPIGFDTDAKKAKKDIIESPVLFDDWKNSRYDNDSHQDKELFKKTINNNEIIITVKSNEKNKTPGDITTYDFIVKFSTPTGDVLVDPRVRNEY